MKVNPIASPHALPPTNSNDAGAKARAVAAFNRATASEAAQTTGAPPINQNAVSVEELSAIQVPEDRDNSTEESTEVPVEAPVEEKAKEDPALSRQFAQLARQERALRAKQQQQDQAFKAKEAELAAREAALSKTQFDPKDYVRRDRLQQDALGTLEAEGIATYDDIAQRAISRQPIDPVLQRTIDSLKSQIDELKQSNETSSKSYQAQQQAAYDSAVKQIDVDARALIKNNPAEYEAIAKTGTVKQVTKLIIDTYNKDGILMTVEEAAQEVENYLVDENYKMSTSISKIQKRMAAANASQSKSDVKTQANKGQTQPGMKTLTNAASSTRQLSAKERAVLAFKGELKS